MSKNNSISSTAAADSRQTCVGLVAYRRDGETWRECVKRNALPYRLDFECLESFDRLVSDGIEESQAAWESMYDWDLGLEVVA